MADVLGFRNTKGEKDGRIDGSIKPLYDEFYSKGSEVEYPLIVSSTPKNWVAINEEDYQEDEFYLSEKELTFYVDGFMETIRQYGQGVYEALFNQPEELEIFNNSALEDNDIKLSLYRSFKSLYDKWIVSSSVNDSGTSPLFYNNISDDNEDEDRLLYDHFQFVNRAYADIGSEAVIDITYMKKVYENPTMSLYQTIMEILSKNNFDFFPLPSNINFTKDGLSDDEKRQMFEPIERLDNIPSSPQYVCMFVGGSSRVLDLKNGYKGDSCIKNNNYENDSFNLDDEILDVSDIVDPSSPGITAFKVAYGKENQSHFTSVELSQDEHKETQESLAIIEQMSKSKEGGGSSTRASKGNSMYDVYLTRSYECTVQGFGNMMIQPLSYFVLENVPMFHGTYLILDVKHSIKPNNVMTTFKGLRMTKTTVPIVKDALSLLNLSDNELSADTERTSITSQDGGKKQQGTANRSNTNYNVSAGGTGTVNKSSKGYAGGCKQPGSNFSKLPFYTNTNPGPPIVSTTITFDQLVTALTNSNLPITVKRVTYAVARAEQTRSGRKFNAFGNNLFGFNVEGNFTGTKESVDKGEIINTFCYGDKETNRVFPQFSNWTDSVELFANNQVNERWINATKNFGGWNSVDTDKRFLNNGIKVSDSDELQLLKFVVLYYMSWNAPSFKSNLVNNIGPATNPTYKKYCEGGRCRHPDTIASVYREAIKKFPST